MSRLINADELVYRLKGEQAINDTTNDYDIGYWNGLTMAQSMTRNAPTIDPESLRARGRWIMRGGKRYCSVCNERACVTRDREDFWYTVGTNYCPNCGAKMED